MNEERFSDIDLSPTGIREALNECAGVDKIRQIIIKMKDCEYDDECETREGLRERYYFVPASLIDAALAQAQPVERKK